MKSGTLKPIAASALALIVVFPNAPALAADGCPAPTFAPAVHYETGRGCWSVAVGDFNGDGKPDLAAANRYANNISVLLGNGDGTFQTAVSYGAGSYYESVAVGDFNADGNADLAVGNGSFGNVSVLLGTGDGTFQAPATYPAGTHPGPLAVADFNRDGKLDLATANVYTDQVTVLLGNGDATFQKAVSYTAGLDSYSVAAGDFNADGNPDLVAPHYFILGLDVEYNGVALLLGNGDGTLQTAIDYGTGGRSPVSVAVGDFNSDGKPDVAAANHNSHNISVLLGKGDGSFPYAATYGAGTVPNSVTASDFNGDGKADLAVANQSGDISLLLNKGDGTFQNAISYPIGDYPRSMAVGDFNGDGKADVAVANVNSGNVSVLLGTCASGGVHLGIERSNSNIILSWSFAYTNYVLESAVSPNLPNWQPVNRETTINNGQCEVTLPLDQSPRYFRLRKT